MRRLFAVAFVACRAATPSVDAGTTSAAPPASSVALPEAPPDEGAIVLVSKKTIMVGDDVVLTLAATGIPPAALRATDSYIVPVGAALERFRKSGLPTHDATLIIDQSTPYRIVAAVLFTLQETKFTRYHFMVLKGLNDDAGAPRPSRLAHFSLPASIAPTGAAPLAFAARIDAAGYTLSTGAGGIAPGCSNAGSGVTLPLRAGLYDTDGLRACARAVRDAAATKLDVDVVLSPAMDVRYETIIQAMDALAKDDAGSLFPEPRFAP